jgi:REP element-mobilizing transposase RayT
MDKGLKPLVVEDRRLPEEETTGFSPLCRRRDRGATIVGKQYWHVTIVTHGSRVSARMLLYGEHARQGIWLEPAEEARVAECLRIAAVRYGVKIDAFTICGDHAHLLLESEAEHLAALVKTLKSVSAVEYKKMLGIPMADPFHLWAQKFNRKAIRTAEQLENTRRYILSNREKHGFSGFDGTAEGSG